MSHHDPDAFCFYCQKQYASPSALLKHLRVKHPDTTAARNLLPKKP